MKDSLDWLLSLSLYLEQKRKNWLNVTSYENRTSAGGIEPPYNREAAKKVPPLVVRPLRGGGGGGKKLKKNFPINIKLEGAGVRP